MMTGTNLTAVTKAKIRSYGKRKDFITSSSSSGDEVRKKIEDEDTTDINLSETIIEKRIS
jgi:hypothetical protein